VLVHGSFSQDQLLQSVSPASVIASGRPKLALGAEIKVKQQLWSAESPFSKGGTGRGFRW